MLGENTNTEIKSHLGTKHSTEGGSKEIMNREVIIIIYSNKSLKGLWSSGAGGRGLVILLL